MPSPIASLSKTGLSETLPTVEEKEKEVQSHPQEYTEKREQAPQVQEQIEEELPKEPEDAYMPQQEEEKVATSSPPQQIEEEVTVQGTPDRIITEILHDILEEAVKEQDTNK